MKRIMAFICALICLISLAACAPQKFDVEITCDGVAIGNSVADVEYSLKIEGKDVEATEINWSVDTGKEMTPITEDTVFEAGKYYQMYIYYPAEKGMTRDNTIVAFSGENGEHGYVEEEKGGLMSLIAFDFTNVPILEINCDYTAVGNTPGDVLTTITYNGTSVMPSKIYWSVDTGDEMTPITEDDVFEIGKYYQMYLYYPISDGMDRDTMSVVFNGANGEHVYVEEDDGEMMSLIGFDFTNIPVLEITCENMAAGNTPADVITTVTYEGDPITPSMINWSVMGEKAFEPIAEDHVFVEGEYYQMYLYYPIAEGMSTETMGVVFNGENGEHGYVEEERGGLMSLIGFDLHIHEWVPDPDKEDVKPTCKEKGAEYRVCSICGIADTKELNTVSHKWTRDTSKKSVPAECLKDGIEYQVCTVCGEKNMKKLPAPGHDYKIDHLMDGSCPDGLLYLYICDVCHDSKRETVGPQEHSWGQAEPNNNSTHSYTCTVCNETKRESHSTDRTGYCATCDYYVVN